MTDNVPNPFHDDDNDSQEQPSPARESWWQHVRRPEGPLAARLRDLREAPDLGWRYMASWIRVAIGTVGILAGAVVLVAIAGGIGDWGQDHTRPGSLPRNLLLTVTDPVRHYLDTHTRSLPLDAATTFSLWAWTGLVALILAAWGSTGGRLTWLGWGAATTAMTWAGTDAPGREIAAAIAVLAWTLASVIALQGLTLRPIVFNTVTNQHRPAVTAPSAPPADFFPADTDRHRTRFTD
ncbi:hypothetical protein ACIRL2_45805 [Embleya sp. NPDC127516]|uniref:hypothetical protein n=1 Tax=Embleya sp. NPDC127516 TaxID=3363990 RepID=UPI00381DFE0A